MKFLICIIFCWMFFNVQAQQDPRFTMFNYNYLHTNPATAGSKERLSMVALHRRQWVSGNLPLQQTTSYTVDMPLFKINSGIGLHLYNDQHGILKSNFMGLIYAIKIPVSKYGKLSFGINLGLQDIKLNYSSIQTDPTNANLPLDPNFNFGTDVQLMSPNLGVGVYYADRTLKLGVSSPLLNSYQYYGLENYGLEDQGVKQEHLFITLGGNFPLNYDWMYNPRTLVKYTAGSPVQAEIYHQFIYKNRLGGGITLRTGESVSATISYTFDQQFNIAYAYDAVVWNQLRKVQKGSHEIGLTYVFKFPKDNRRLAQLDNQRRLACPDNISRKKKKFMKEIEDLIYDRI